MGNGSQALQKFLGFDILSDLPFATIFRGGAQQQTGPYGWIDSTLANQVTALNQSMFTKVYGKSDFK